MWDSKLLQTRAGLGGAGEAAAAAVGIAVLTQHPDTMRLVDAVLGAVPWDANGVVAPAPDAVQGEAAVPAVVQMHDVAQVHLALQHDAVVSSLARCVVH